MGPTTYRYSRRRFLALSSGAIIAGFAAAQGASLAVADDVPATADIYDVTDFGATGGTCVDCGGNNGQIRNIEDGTTMRQLQFGLKLIF